MTWCLSSRHSRQGGPIDLRTCNYYYNRPFARPSSRPTHIQDTSHIMLKPHASHAQYTLALLTFLDGSTGRAEFRTLALQICSLSARRPTSELIANPGCGALPTRSANFAMLCLAPDKGKRKSKRMPINSMHTTCLISEEKTRRNNNVSAHSHTTTHCNQRHI